MADRNVGVKQLAATVGVHENTIKNMRKDFPKTIPVDLLESLCWHLTCEPADLFQYRREDRTPHIKRTKPGSKHYGGSAGAAATQRQPSPAQVTWGHVFNQVGLDLQALVALLDSTPDKVSRLMLYPVTGCELSRVVAMATELKIGSDRLFEVCQTTYRQHTLASSAGML